MKDLLTIQEFSKLTGVEVSKLHYWEKNGLFGPAKRNPESGYRYYSLVQVIALNFVTTLSEIGIPLKMIGKLRRERDPAELMKLLEQHLKHMDSEMSKLRQRYSIVHARQELIRSGLSAEDTQISVMRLEDMPLIIWPRNTYEEGDTFIEPLARFIRQTGDHHINLGFPVGGYHESLESFVSNPSTPDHFVSYDPTGQHARKAGSYIVGFTMGYYSEMGDLPEKMTAYARENGLKPSGPVYTTYLLDEICVSDSDQYLAQVCVSIDRL